MRTRREFFRAAGTILGAVVLRAQGDEATFKTDVKVVDLLATVRTKKGEYVRDLTKDNFSVLEDGHPQAIRYFSRETDLPLTLGLLIDTSMSQQKVLEAERAASFRFLDQVLRENKDQVFLMQFDMTVMLKQELTSARRKLEDVLSLVDVPTRQDLQAQTGGGTMLYDAVLQASRDIMKNQRNRKALIILSDGVDTGSQATLDAAIEAAQRADTLIYSIEFSDEGYYGGGGLFGPNGGHVLMRLAKETGGSYFEVTRKRSIDQVYGQIQDELRSQYSLGFVSDKPVRVSEFRKLQIMVDQKGLAVQSRGKYWAQR